MTAEKRSGLPASMWGGLLIGGAIAVVLGLIVVFNPFDSVRFVTVVVGIAFAAAGVFGIVAAARGTSRVSIWGPVVALIGGIILIVVPEGSVKALAVIVGIILLAFGMVTIAGAMTRRDDGGWGPVLVGAVLGVLGLIVIVWPGPTLSLVAVLVGISVLVAGVGMIAQAFRLRGLK